MIGEVLKDRYRIAALLGEGGMGTVYSAHDDVLGRDVAVKMLTHRVDDEARDRLIREARAAAALSHPNIVGVFDAGESDGMPFIVMERVEGGSLREAGALPIRDLLAVARQLCAALAHAHEHGIVHRDLKPENILVAGNGGGPNVKIADLGLAITRRSARLTEEGTLVGTALYMAPEQALGQPLDGRADLYALGAVLYELATGRPPFIGDDALAVVSQHLHAPVVPPRTYRAELPPEFEGVVVRLLAKSPAERFATAKEVAAALDEVGAAPASDAVEAPSTDRMILLRQLARGRLVGRRAELDQLREHWRLALQGQGSMVLLSGEPGIGKTRLANELMVYARLSGGLVISGGCYEFEATTPYMPFVEAFGQWVRGQEDAALRERLGPTATEVAKLAPAIEARIGPLPPNPPLGASEERIRLFDHVALFLQRLSSQSGLLIVLDDLHWADHGTLALLRFLLRQIRHQRVLVLGAYREAELDRAHPLNAALVEWNRERLAMRVALGRFELAETNHLLASLFGQERVSEDFAEALHRETEGNPFFVEEVVKSLIEDGQIYRDAGAWQRREVATLAIPQGVKAAIGHRLSRLRPECAEVLHTAAALGKSFLFSELAAVAAQGEDALLDALDEAAGAQLIRPNADESFVFTHDKIREVLHQEINPIRKRRLHLRIGESLERLYADDLDAHAADLAYHFTESTDLERGLAYAIEAGIQARRLFAHDEALRFYERARECAEALEDTRRLAEVEEALGETQAGRGHSIEAAAHYERALGMTDGPREQARLRTRIGEAYARVGDPRGLPPLEEALRTLDPATQQLELAEATAVFGRYHHYRGEHERALAYLEKAHALAEPLDDVSALSTIQAYLCGALQHLTRFDESNRWAQRNVALGERHGDDHAIASGYEFMAENCTGLGAWARAIEFADLDEQYGRRCGSLDRVAWAGLARSFALLGRGDLAGAVEAARQALALCDRIGEGRLARLLWTVVAFAETDRGNDEAAREAADRSQAERSAAYIWSQGRHALGYWHLGREAWSEAAAVYDEVDRRFEETDNRFGPALVAPARARSLIATDRFDEAAARIEEDLARARASGMQDIEARLLAAKGWLLERHGAGDEALARYTEAHDAHEGIGSLLEAARARRSRARVLLERGDRAGAAADLAAARETFEESGARRDLDRADRLIAGVRKGAG